ncbi:hypothetical protein EDD15DRAFT_2173323, partial [Pisolithus albus]
IMRSCDAVVSGSTALRLLLPEIGTPWNPTDLDIYVPRSTSIQMLRRLKAEGYNRVSEKRQDDARYRNSDVASVILVSNGRNMIDIIISRTSAAISPIFQFHSTVVMNFVSADTVFCCYPNLTLRLLSLVNAGPLYNGLFSMTTMDAMWKYISRGVRYVRCKDVHKSHTICKSKTRFVTDAGVMWLRIQEHPYPTHSTVEVFRQFGILDVQWITGGVPCDLAGGFCRPRVHVVEDES